MNPSRLRSLSQKLNGEISRELSSTTSGGFEFSIPYQLAITAGLALLLLFLLAFRFGKYSNRASQEPAVRSPQSNAGTDNRDSLPKLASTENTRTPTSEDTGGSAVNREPAPVVLTGNYVIRLAQLKTKTDMIPAVDFFKSKNIQTEIVTDGNWYFLQTVERFKDNPNNAGTKGNDLIKEIVKIGKEYKAPDSSYGSFAPNYFSDAYGYNIVN